MKRVKTNKKYWVSYRDELEVLVEAENEEEAVYEAELSNNWRFILREGHKDMFEVSEEDKN